jgi:hypothetical protein
MKSWTFLVRTSPLADCVFTTNLDLHQAERMPTTLLCVPRAGDMIESSTVHNRNPQYRLTLEVVRVTHALDKLIVELHLPKTFNQMSLRDWYKNIYEPITGGSYV